VDVLTSILALTSKGSNPLLGVRLKHIQIRACACDSTSIAYLKCDTVARPDLVAIAALEQDVTAVASNHRLVSAAIVQVLLELLPLLGAEWRDQSAKFRIDAHIGHSAPLLPSPSRCNSSVTREEAGRTLTRVLGLRFTGLTGLGKIILRASTRDNLLQVYDYNGPSQNDKLETQLCGRH
jgi:hypothetical protein